MQLVGGVDSPLRFYDITDVHRGVGFFANSNHQAAFLYAIIPYAAIWASLSRHSPSERRVFHLTFSAIVLIVVVIGLPATLSRFGVFLGLVAGLCSIPLVASLASWRRTRTHHQGCSDCKRRSHFCWRFNLDLLGSRSEYQRR